MKVVSVSVTEAGRRLADLLPYEHLHGDAAGRVAALWDRVDAMVLFLAVGASVRIVAPHLGDKATDPAIVCVDQAGRFAVALTGAHRGAPGEGGANALARTVASVLGAEPVLTTAADSAGAGPLDSLPGFRAAGDLSGVSAAILDGRSPRVDNPLAWPLPAGLPDGEGPERILVTDTECPTAPGTAVLHPPSLVAGVGASTGAQPAEVARLLADSLRRARLAEGSLGEVATVDRRAGDEALGALGLPIRSFSPGRLAGVRVPGPSKAVEEAVGTPSVAEAAALLAAGPGAELVVAKRRSAHATVAVARRAAPRGRLSVVGLGPGSALHRTPAADRAVRRAEVVVGLEGYLRHCGDLLGPGQQVLAYEIGDEAERARRALAEAAAGRRVALVCSGDPGTYAMASLVLELSEELGAGPGDDATPAITGFGDLELEVVPGVPAAVASSALLGAPLGHDHASVSLSDLLTPWEVIEKRLHAAGRADLVVALYNPRSTRRRWQLDAAVRILARYRTPDTPVGVASDAGRPGERACVATLATLDPADVGMTTCVIVGSSSTRVVDGRMVTPRGYLR